MLSAQQTDSTPVQLRWDEAFGVSLKLFLPVKIHVGNQWESTPGLYSTYATLHTLLGWIFIPVAIASITGVMRRDPPR